MYAHITGLSGAARVASLAPAKGIDITYGSPSELSPSELNGGGEGVAGPE